jgi:hypothetical protein|tara:strand:+ start:2496 stop:5018 length:2523 start_codon:yes stop_codon:yes gene_type:complete
MATEKNPYEKMAEQITNVIPMPTQEQTNEGPTYQLEDDGGITVDFSEESIEMGASIEIEEWYGNLAENMDEEELEEIGSIVLDDFSSDKESRAEWEAMFERGFDLLGLKIQDTAEPFEGACTAVHPLLIESAVKFQSKASQELFPSKGPVKAQILGKVTPDKEMQANRVQDFMNYQVTEQMPEYFDEFERMLFHLPLIGSAFKKVYYDATLKRPVSEFVPIDQFYVSYYASNLRKADRYTHVVYRSPVDLAKEIRSGLYLDLELPEASNPTLTPLSEKMDTILGLSPTMDSDPQYTLLEQHCYLDIKDSESEEGESLPYIVTIEEQSRQVLSIRRNFKPDDPTKEKNIHFVHYRFVPGFSFYGLGLMHFLGNITMTATAAMRSLVDAGQFANLPGGFKAKGVRMVGDNDPIAPGEFKEVEALGIDLSKAIVPLPYKEPSQTLFQMLGFMTTAGQKFADSTEQVVADAASYGPVGTTMALLEASSKFFSAIHKRLHKSQREEFKLLADIDFNYLPDEYPYDVPMAERNIFKADFDGKVDIIPVSDPNIPSNAHRLMLSQMTLQMAQQSPPGMFNLEALNRSILNAVNMPNIDEILPPKPEPKPMDPVSDILAASKGIPIAAFAGQDHEAHMQVKMAYLQDPQNGGSPTMQRLQPILASNIQEHSVMKYQEQMNGLTQQKLQQNVAPEQAQNPAVVQGAMAEAAQEILNANMAMGKQQSPEQQMVELEQKRVELDMQKLQLQAAKDNAQAVQDAQEMELKQTEMLLKTAQGKEAQVLKEQKAEADRLSKQQMKALDMLSKLTAEENRVQIEADKIESQEKMKALDVLNDMTKQETITIKEKK